MIISSLYIWTVLLSLAIGLAATAYVNANINKYKKHRSTLNITGAEMEPRMHLSNGVTGV